ncbi:MAG: hypothetical protein GWP06_02885 [Actinobacteria bacterium]|nr:hypothetical protein [Actinomycetota bacterium]
MKRKYNTAGEEFNLKALINRIRHNKFKAIYTAMGLIKNDAVDQAIQDFNEKNKKVLG